MKTNFILALLSITTLFNSCTNGQTRNGVATNLSATEFSAKIKDLSSAPLLDVRTPDEFSKGHLKNAKNVDWNGNDFDAKVATLDKTKPVLVYCLSGGRSGAAANKLRNDGFKEVYELDGGIMKWRGANLPETTDNTVAAAGMTEEQFNALLVNDKLVLIDFYADWCAPCKRMKPYLDEISKEMEASVVVIRINADDNQALCKALKIDALPVLQLYKNKMNTWENIGYISKDEVVKQLR